jgi:hypothetical protein
LLKASGLKVPQGQFALQAQNFTAAAGQITGQLFKFYAASSPCRFNIDPGGLPIFKSATVDKFTQ